MRLRHDRCVARGGVARDRQHYHLSHHHHLPLYHASSPLSRSFITTPPSLPTLTPSSTPSVTGLRHLYHHDASSPPSSPPRHHCRHHHHHRHHHSSEWWRGVLGGRRTGFRRTGGRRWAYGTTVACLGEVSRRIANTTISLTITTYRRYHNHHYHAASSPRHPHYRHHHLTTDTTTPPR